MKISALVFALTLLTTLAAAGPADAQSRRDRQAGSTYRAPALGVHPVGAYGGVHPGVKRAKAYKDRRPVVNRSRRKNIVRWIGFQPKGAGSRIFIQLTSDVEYDQRIDGSDLVVTLGKTRLGGSNARRPLDTRYFDTVIRRVVAKRARRRGTEVRISFKNPADAAQASASMSKNETDGFTYLFLDFGASKGGTAAPDDNDDDEVEIDDGE